MNKTSKTNNTTKWSWVIKIFAVTIILASLLSLASEAALRNFSLPLAFLALIFFVFLGILFDTIGVAVATADMTPFVAMSSKRVRGAKEGLFLLQRAEIVANICNDVVGDICGIISGAAGGIIVITLVSKIENISSLMISVILSALIAGFTVSGKALGKIIAMRDNKEIVLIVGRVIHVFTGIWRKDNGKYFK
ncbi:MAG: hypothetical protein JXN65_00835 [Clostridia bacterium]|nr:hypothetical protein [Clostridia bacterium]